MEQLKALAPLILLILIMYFLLIRPQKKREKEVNSMRAEIKTGDQIITIGGIYGTVVKAKDEQLVIQVGADKTKLEIARWAVSKLVNEEPAGARAKKSSADQEEKAEAKKIKPKKLEKATAAASEAENTVVTAPPAEEVQTPAADDAPEATESKTE